MDLEALYRELSPQIVAFFARRLAPSDRHMAEDMAADVFVRILGAMPRYEARGGNNPYGLVWTVARNLLTDHHRRRHPYGVACTLDAAVHDRADESATRDMEAVTAVVSLPPLDLTPEQRLALDAKYWRGETWPQASARTGLTVEALKKLNMRAIARLRKRMAA